MVGSTKSMESTSPQAHPTSLHSLSYTCKNKNSKSRDRNSASPSLEKLESTAQKLFCSLEGVDWIQQDWDPSRCRRHRKTTSRRASHTMRIRSYFAPSRPSEKVATGHDFGRRLYICWEYLRSQSWLPLETTRTPIVLQGLEVEKPHTVRTPTRCPSRFESPQQPSLHHQMRLSPLPEQAHHGPFRHPLHAPKLAPNTPPLPT